PVAVIDHLGAHLGHLLGDPVRLHDRLFGPVRDALADRARFHDLFGHIALAAHGAGARLRVVLTPVAGAVDLPLLLTADGAADLTLFLHPLDAVDGDRSTGLAAAVSTAVSTAVSAAAVATSRGSAFRPSMQEGGLGAPNEGDRHQASQ